ncbi:unnamed protein product [Rotaria sp. Silwood2]|nr:unnamed protein product [Rotaria sp. Silwood2]CAF4664506.1 unnamed protein product [Rotaria sp. Silwood2]
MLRTTLATNDNNGVNAPFLSSNHKVIQYLRNSEHRSRNFDTYNNYTDNKLMDQHKISSHGHELFSVKDAFKNNNHNQCQQRMHVCSENSSESSTIDTLSRCDFSFHSSLSDNNRRCSTFSSNTSSSGICSAFSDVGHEESASTLSEDLDFNLGFDQISDNDDFETFSLDEIDEYEQNERENQRISNKNSCNTATLVDFGQSNSDGRNKELEKFLRKSYSSTTLNGNIEFHNDDKITENQTKQQQCTSVLHDSTNALCSSDRFSVYSESGDHEKDKVPHAIGTRSNSLGIALIDRKSALLDKPPKKVVRFADMLGLDLESVRYMTPPDQSPDPFIQECIRNKLEQLWLVKSQPNILSTSPCPFDLANIINRSSSSAFINTSKKSTNQYYLVSKYFTSPKNIIQLIYERQIMLECLYTKDSIAYGTVRVHNRAHKGRVFARISENDWKTFEDIYAMHSMNYPNNNTDTFTFEIHLGKYDNNTKVPKQIYFAICLQTNNQEFWDNNCGWNYALYVLER